MKKVKHLVYVNSIDVFSSYMVVIVCVYVCVNSSKNKQQKRKEYEKKEATKSKQDIKKWVQG